MVDCTCQPKPTSGEPSCRAALCLARRGSKSFTGGGSGCMVRARLHAHPARTHYEPSCGHLPARQRLPVCPAACATLPACAQFSQRERV